MLTGTIDLYLLYDFSGFTLAEGHEVSRKQSLASFFCMLPPTVQDEVWSSVEAVQLEQPI